MAVFSRHWLNEQTKEFDAGLLEIKGPALNVSISPPDDLINALQDADQPIPNSESGTSLIDTGAAFTAIDIEILTRLGLKPVRTTLIFGPTGEEEQGVYQVKLEFVGTAIPAFEHTVIGSQLKRFNHSALIGRDILKYFLLVYNGVEGTWSLAI